MSKLKDLAKRAGQWLGLAEAPAKPKHTGAIVADRFDAMSWGEIYEQAPPLAALAEELNEKYDHTTDLLRDLWLGAYKASPQVREREEMETSRLVNHQVVSTILATPEFTELREETAGDEYSSAMAVLAQKDALRSILERTQQAQDEAEAQQKAEQDEAEAARQVAEALDQATEQADENGNVPGDAAQNLEAALAAAEAAALVAAQAGQQAGQSLAAAATGVRGLARAAAAEALEKAQAEKALSNAWGVEPGQLTRMNFEERAALAARLANGRLAKFVQLIGRFKLMAEGQRARRVEHAPGELVGITLGSDLSRVIPSEISMLGVPAMRAVFAAKYASDELMEFETRGEQNVGQGAIIALIDCSGSMLGRREAWAKACSLALLDQARNAAPRRDFVAILFASKEQQHVIRFPAGQPVALEDVLDLGEHFFNGGTDFQAPLSIAVDLLEAEYNAEGRAKGDILIITDGVAGISEEWKRGWDEAKARLSFRSFGIAIEAPSAIRPGSVLDALCDNVRDISDLTSPDAVADLYRTI
ncbi:VWA domain-containing protein [Lentzea chajnantorensis]